MEHKKSRLDLDTSSSSMQDTSPNARMSPFHSFNMSLGGGGPHRGRYTRSSLGGGGGGGIPTTSSSTSSSRFSPYSLNRDRPAQRRSIPVIRAQRDEQSMNKSLFNFTGGGGLGGNSSILGSTSSTAQKIMDTLASMSTPVFNAGRVRIDSIKPVKPIGMGSGSSVLNSSGTFLSSSNKFSGPPKTLSPLLLPKNPTGFRPDPEKSMWSLNCLSIPPKMVDRGTITDNDNDIIRRREPEDVKAIKMNVTPPPTVVQRKSFSDITMPGIGKAPPAQAQGSSRLADLIAKSRPVNGEYKFDKAWSLSEVDKYLASDQCKKDLERERETSSTSSSDTTSDEVQDCEEYENENENEDSSMTNMSNHKIKIPNGDVKLGGDSKIKQDGFTFKASPLPLAKWGTPPKENNVSVRWECPTCMVFNNANIVKCVCCGSSYPEETKPKRSSSPFGKSDTAGKELFPAKSVAPAKWTCPTCMVPNEASAPACVCCSEPNPDKTKSNPASIDKIDSVKSFTTSPSSSGPPIPTFKFGISTASAATTTASTPVPAFGSGFTAPTTTPAPTPSFQFGLPTASPATSTSTSAFGSSTSFTTATSTPTPAPMFRFGGATTTTTPTAIPAPAAAFGSGTSSATTTATPAPAPAFGSGTSSTTTTAVPAATPMFKFGTSTAPTSTPSFGSGSGNTGPTPTPSFQFGTPVASTTTPAAVAPTFGSSTAPAQPAVPPPMFQFGNPTATPTPAFGSTAPSPSPVFQFQSKPSTTAVPVPSFQFGTPSAPISTSTSAPGLDASNPFNFGGTPTRPPNVFSFGTPQNTAGPPSAPGAPPPLFQFQSNPSNNAGPDGRRKIKAARRFNR